jgi:hypothetical protein
VSCAVVITSPVTCRIYYHGMRTKKKPPEVATDLKVDSGRVTGMIGLQRRSPIWSGPVAAL